MWLVHRNLCDYPISIYLIMTLDRYIHTMRKLIVLWEEGPTVNLPDPLFSTPWCVFPKAQPLHLLPSSACLMVHVPEGMPASVQPQPQPLKDHSLLTT